MNLKNYQDFMEAMNFLLKDEGEVKLVKGSDELDGVHIMHRNNKKGLGLLVSEAKPFDIDEDTKKLLLMTNPPKNPSLLRLPFPVIFIDTGFLRSEAELDDNESEISGILVWERPIFLKEDPNSKKGRMFNVLCRVNTVKPDGSFDMMCLDESIFQIEGDVLKIDYERSKRAKTLQKFIYNFVLFLNQSDVQIIESHRSDKSNEKRIYEGKLPLPKLTKVVRLTGILKEYVNSLHTNGHFSYSHRFWVRGHFRTLRSVERYGSKAGSQLWILPFIKGKGMLIDKIYNVKRGVPN